jgi:hypothetical protein
MMLSDNQEETRVYERYEEENRIQGLNPVNSEVEILRRGIQ